MAQFLRGRQSGVQKDLSDGLLPNSFTLVDFARCGISSQISSIVYDPVKSLLAVGTNDTQFGSGQIYVFGQRRVLAVFSFSRKASSKFLQFCGDKLVSVDSKNEITVFSLETRQALAVYTPSGQVTALLTDPSLDYALLGLQNGDIIAYDLDRECLTPYRIPNLWAGRSSRARLFPVVDLSFSPRDIGKILVGYPEGAVVFSLKQNVAQHYLEYEVPSGALGGNSDLPSTERQRPRLMQALWHPNGIFVLTVHDDNSLVFWDSKDGRKILARSIQAINIDKPGVNSPVSSEPTLGSNEGIVKVAWCVKENGDDSGLLIAGGRSASETGKGLTFLDLGPSTNYQTSSWSIISKFFENARQQAGLPTPPGAEVTDFCIIPRSSPYYNGAHDPIALITLLSSGELIMMSFPSGHPITPTNMIHPYLSFVQPFVSNFSYTPIDRGAWLGLRERRSQGPKFLLGGMEAKKNPKRFEHRNILTTAHADGILRLWDPGHDDEIENSDMMQVDITRALGRSVRVEVSEISVAGSTGELSAGLKSGEVVVFRWGNNSRLGFEEPPGPNQGAGCLTDITHRTDPNLKRGMLPLTLLEMQRGAVTALKHGEVGFVAAGFESGDLVVIDLRGPSLIYTGHVADYLKVVKRSALKRGKVLDGASTEWPTSIEFGVLTVDNDDYSSICCFVGTNKGSFATLKILPTAGGKYTVTFIGTTALDGKVIGIYPVDADRGATALATPNAVAGLREGTKINGVVVVVTPATCRVFKPATSKGAHRSWDDYLCDSAAVVKTEGRGYSLVGLFGDGNARAFSIPALREIGCYRIGHLVDMRRLSSSCISPTGNIVCWTGPSEVVLFNAWGARDRIKPPEDQLLSAKTTIPPRPTITNIQWISGTQYVSPADMDILIGGSDRPPSKQAQEQMRLEEQERRKAARAGRTMTNQSTDQDSQEGYWAYMQRQVQERTEKLGLAGDQLDRLEEQSSNWAKDVNKYVQSQKKKAVFGLLGSKFGL